MEKSIRELQAENTLLRKELKKITETGLGENLLLEQIIINISTRFVNLKTNNLPVEIDRALAEVGLFTGIDRAYVFLYNYKDQEINNTNEWCAQGINKQIEGLKNLPIDLYPWWNNKLIRNEEINLYSLDDLPAEAVPEREILKKQSFLSLLAVPIIHSGKVTGFIGFDSVRKPKKWTKREVRILRLLAEIFGSAINKSEIEKKLTDSLEKYRLLVENSIAAILIADHNGKYHFANTIAGRNVNMSPEEVIGKSVYDFFPKNQADLFVSNTRKVIKLKKRTEHINLTQIGNRFRWLKTIVEPLTSDAGNDKVMIISYDIHEEKTKSIKIEELNRRLKVLSKIDRAIINHFDSKDDFYKTVLLHIFTLIPADIITFATIGHNDQRVEVQSLLIKGKSEDTNHFSLDYKKLNLKLSEKETPLIVHLDKENLQSGFQSFLFQQKIRSYLILPVFYSDQAAGVLLLLSEKKRFFNNDHLEIVNEISQQLTIGYRQMVFSEQIKHQNENLEKIVEQRTREIHRISGLNNSIINTTGSLIFSMDTEGTILTMNPVAENILGYQINEVVNRKKISDIYSPAAFQVFQEKIEKGKKITFKTTEAAMYYIANNIKEPVEFTLIAKDGTHIPVMMSVNRILDESGRIIYYAAVAIDIRKRIEAEKALQLQQVAFENFAHALVISDVDGNLIWCNASYEKLSGYSFEELKKEKVGRLEKSGVHSEKFYQQLWKTILEGKVWRGEVINKRKDGTLFPEDLTISPLKNAKGDIINFIAIKIDISEKKKAEQELKESNQIKEGLLNTFPDLLFYLDKEGTYKDVFTLHDEKLISPKEKIIGKRLEEVLSPDLAKKVKDSLIKVLATKETVIFNYSAVVHNRKYYYENRIVGISDNEVLSINRDITDTRLAESYSLDQRKLGFKLAAVTNPAEAIKLMIKYILKPEEISAVGFFLYDATANRFQLADYAGISGDLAKKLKEIVADIFPDKLVDHKKLKMKAVKDVVTEPELLQKENFSQVGYKPIIYGKKLLGFLAFGSPSTEKFGDILVNHIGLIASQMSGALYRIYTQQQLISSQENFRLLFNTIDEFLFIIDKAGNLIEFNKNVENKLGYTRKELYGRSVTELNPPATREEVRSIIEEMLAGERFFCTVPLYSKNGDTLPVETKVAMGKWNNNDALFALSRDISQRLKFEDQLRKSEARWQFALESSGDGIWDWNFSTGKVFYSKQWKNMLGYNENEISDTSEEWESRIHPEDSMHIMRDLNLYIKGETDSFHNEHRILCKNGEYKWILDRGKIISRDINGNPERMIGTHTDISTRKNIENSLVMALQKEKELNELKSRFVSMASHEFRTPLAIMLMASESLEANWDRMTIAERNKKIERLKSSIEFLRNIIEKTLNLSRLESGKINFSPTKENLNFLVRHVIEKVSESFNNDHQINFKGVSGAAVIHADKQMIDEVISNLLTNSFKYSEAGTTIDVIIKRKDKGYTIEITDRGLGIAEEAQNKIFDAFWRAPNVKNIHGTGLGLAISRKFIQMHGGDITFISKVNQGTTFTVFLPGETGQIKQRIRS